MTSSKAGMRYALVDGVKSYPFKLGRGHCLCCGSEVIARCGDIKVHHWAHKNKGDCEYSSKEMTDWHREWQARFPEECREVRVIDESTGKVHIADVKLDNGLVIEFQHSNISREAVESREFHYGKNMVWVVDCNSGAPFVGTKHNMYVKQETYSFDYTGSHSYYSIYYDRHSEKLDIFTNPVLLDFDHKRNQWYILFPGVYEVIPVPKSDIAEGLSFIIDNKNELIKELNDKHTQRKAFCDNYTRLTRLRSKEITRLSNLYVHGPLHYHKRSLIDANLKELKELNSPEKLITQLEAIIERQANEEAKLDAEIEIIRQEELSREKLREEELAREKHREEELSREKHREEELSRDLPLRCSDANSRFIKCVSKLRMSLRNLIVDTDSTLYNDIEIFISEIETFIKESEEIIITLSESSSDKASTSELISSIEHLSRKTIFTTVRTNIYIKKLEETFERRPLSLLEKERFRKLEMPDSNLSQLDKNLQNSKTNTYFKSSLNTMQSVIVNG